MLTRRSILAIAASMMVVSSSVQADEQSFVLATTTSTENSGLLDAIIPQFTTETGIMIKVVAVGTGQALELGRRGDAAALLTHDREGEEQFVANQHGVDRRDVMFNDFVLIGPADDPAGVLGSKTTDEAFTRLSRSEVPFISRGDDSGTHRKELRLWEQAKIEIGVASDWYVEAGSGMGQTIITTMEIGGYTLSDRATWAKFSNKDDYIIAFEQSPPLFNPYSSILVNNSVLSDEQLEIAKQWHEWLTSPIGQKAIEDYRFNGQQLFFIGAPVSPG